MANTPALPELPLPDTYSSGEVALSNNTRWVRHEDFDWHLQQYALAAIAANRVVVDEAMAERAWRAGRAEYSKRVKLSKEWDEPNSDDIASMKAALIAALASA